MCIWQGTQREGGNVERFVDIGWIVSRLYGLASNSRICEFRYCSYVGRFVDGGGFPIFGLNFVEG